MKFISVRDLRGNSAAIWRDLPDEGEMIITSNGRPVALLSSVDESDVEESLTAFRRARVERAIADLQRASVAQGTDTLSMDAIELEIMDARKTRPRS
jgi:antitoxin (DNA-binding transcriptional repressor) of toxin-antitoxin stability system